MGQVPASNETSPSAAGALSVTRAYILIERLQKGICNPDNIKNGFSDVTNSMPSDLQTENLFETLRLLLNLEFEPLFKSASRLTSLQTRSITLVCNECVRALRFNRK
jgi:hypothetical protein